MTANGVQPNDWTLAIVGSDDDGERRQNIFDYGLAGVEVPLVVHAQFRQRASADHRHLVVQSGADHCACQNQTVDRSAAKGFDVRACGIFESTHLADGLCHVPAASLERVPDSLFAGVQNVLDSCGVETAIAQ